MWNLLAGPLIGAGAQLLGGLFSKPAKNRTDFVQMRKDAEAGGFNPASVLRAGGAAGYGYTHGGVSPIGAALASFGSSVAQMSFDPLDTDRKVLENRLLGAQIANTEASTTAMSRAPVAVSYTGGDPMQGYSPGSTGGVMGSHIEDAPQLRSGFTGETYEPGPINETGWMKTPTGFLPVRSIDATERMEDDPVGAFLWYGRNYVGPFFGGTPPDKPKFLDGGYKYDPSRMGYFPKTPPRKASGNALDDYWSHLTGWMSGKNSAAPNW